MFKAIPTISALSALSALFTCLISITIFASIFDTAITDEEKKQVKSLLSNLPKDLMGEYTPIALFNELISKTPSLIKGKAYIIFITHDNITRLYSYSGQSFLNKFHLVIIAQEEGNSVIVYDPILKEWLPYNNWFLSFINFKNDSDANTVNFPSWEKIANFINSNNHTKHYSPLFFIFPFSHLRLPEEPQIDGITAPITHESIFNINPNSNTNQLFNNTSLDESQEREREKKELLYLITLKPTYMNIFEACHLSLKSLFEKEVVTVENIHTTGATAASYRLTTEQLSDTFELFNDQHDNGCIIQ